MSDRRHANPDSLLRRFDHAGIILSVLLLLGGAAGLLTGSLHFGPCTVTGTGVDSGHENDEDQEQTLEGGDPNALESAACEHGTAAIACDRCRFELGVVKLDATVAKALIQTDTVREIEAAETLTLIGQVQLDETRVVDVPPTAGGRIERVEKLLGQTVDQGDVLVVIRSAELGQARAQYLEAQARLELARATLSREKELAEKGISSQADYLLASSELKLAEANDAAAGKRLRVLGLSVEEVEATTAQGQDDRFAELIVKAPRAGTIIAQDSSVGTLAEPTRSLCTIADLSHLWVWCDLYESDLALLQQEMATGRVVTAKVEVKAFAGIQFEGVVDLLGSALEEHTRTVKVRIQVENRDGMLRPGMFAEARIALPPSAATTVVPRAAVLSDDGNSFVFQHFRDDLWVRRDVVVGKSAGLFVEVLQGVEPGAVVVTSGGFMLKSDILREKMGAGCAD